MDENEQEKLNAFQILIILLSIYVLAALSLDTVFTLPTETSNLGSVLICITGKLPV